MSTVDPVVIIGGGTAGCIVARTLAGMTDRDLVLVEPGSLTDDDNPRFMDALGAATVVDVAGMPQAVALGGGSAVNGMILSGDEPEWLRGLTSVAREVDAGSVGRALLSAGGRLSRLWWNNGRWNPARAMLHVEEEERLRVIRTTAHRIVMEGSRATGVECDGETVPASHVVVCGGAVSSPLVMQASGIAAVTGEGLQNHPTVSYTFDRVDEDRGAFDAVVVMDIVDGGAIGLVVAYERQSAMAPGRGLVTVSLMNPESRGSVTAAGVDFNLLGTAGDREAMSRLASRTRDVLAQMGVTEFDESAVHPVSHATSSCAGSVNGSGRVNGTVNVTVADASVLPHVPHETPAASVTIEALRIARLLGRELA